MISEETDKELPYLPILLFHKVRTSCVLFRAQIAMALWTESVRVFEATKKISYSSICRLNIFQQARNAVILMISCPIAKSISPFSNIYCAILIASFSSLAFIRIHSVSISVVIST